MTTTEAYDSGRDRGILIAECADMPKIGQSIDKYDLPNFEGVIKNIEDCQEVFMGSCFESETENRQFTPFEFTAAEINGHEEFEAAELWEEFDSGITDGISETWEKQRLDYNDNPVVVISAIKGSAGYAGGWDVSVVPSDPKTSISAETGSISYDKARVLSNLHRDQQGQEAEIIWLHKYDTSGHIVEV